MGQLIGDSLTQERSKQEVLHRVEGIAPVESPLSCNLARRKHRQVKVVEWVRALVTELYVFPE